MTMSLLMTAKIRLKYREEVALDRKRVRHIIESSKRSTYKAAPEVSYVSQGD